MAEPSVKDRPHIIYKVRNAITRKLYIGITCQPRKVRWQRHCRSAFGDTPSYEGGRYLLHNSMRKHGIEAFEFEVICTAINLREARSIERGLIAQYGTLAPLGYNLTSGGEGAEPSPETVKKMRDSHAGKTLTAEHRANISKGHKGRELSPPELANLNWTGRKHTPESIAKMSAVQSARPPRGPCTPEARVRMSIAQRKRPPREPLSDEHKAKISAANKGRRFTFRGPRDEDEILRNTLAYLKSPIRRSRKNDLPRGVRKAGKKWRASIGKLDVGVFDTPEKASEAHKFAKNKRIYEIEERLRFLGSNVPKRVV